MTDSAEKMREAIKRFHRNCCYPEAFDFEVDGLMNELAALSASGTKSDGGVESRHAKTGNMSGAVPEEEQSLPASGFVRAFGPEDKTSKPRDGVAPIPSDPIPSQPDERERIRQIIELAMIEEAEIQYADFADRDRQREKIITSAAAAILAMQAERRGHDPLGDLVQRFADALLAKLRLAQANGRSGWDQDDWEEACRKGLMRHIEKGDPRDVAAYCAFMWHHGWSTAPPKPDPIAPLTEGSFVKGGHNSFPSQIKDRPAAPAPINKPPAQPAPIAGLEPVAWRFTKLSVWHVTSERNWAEAHGDCVEPLYTLAQLEAHAAEQVRPLVEALEGLIEAVELDADEGLEGIGSYTGARLTDAKNAIRARGQV